MKKCNQSLTIALIFRYRIFQELLQYLNRELERERVRTTPGYGSHTHNIVRKERGEATAAVAPGDSMQSDVGERKGEIEREQYSRETIPERARE